MVFPQLEVSPPAFAVAGMAGVVGGATGAAMAAIVMIFEMTLDYSVIVPMTITVAISYGVRKVLSQESIYTMKLARRGHYLPEVLRTSPHFVRRAKDLAVSDFGPVVPSMTLREFAVLVSQRPSSRIFLVTDNNSIVGFVRNTDALRTLNHATDTLRLGDIVDRNFIWVSGETSLYDVIAGMHSRNAAVALIVEGSGSVSATNVKGVISRLQLADAVVEAAELFQD